MVDELTFTTTVNGSVNPAVVFTPVTSAFQLTRASLTAGADRSDVHQVSVGLAIAASGMAELDTVRSFLFSRERGALGSGVAANSRSVAAPVVLGRRITGSGRSASEVLAVLAVDQFKSRQLQLIPPP